MSGDARGDDRPGDRPDGDEREGAAPADRSVGEGAPLRALPARPPKHQRRAWGDRYVRTVDAASVDKLVRGVLAAHHVQIDIRRERLFAEWSTFVGELIAARTRPREIVGIHLVVEVASSSWLHELRLLRPKLVADLLAKLGAPRLFDDLRLVLASERPRQVTARAPAAAAAPPGARRSPQPASGAMAIRIIKESEVVEDPELRALITKVRLANDR